MVIGSTSILAHSGGWCIVPHIGTIGPHFTISGWRVQIKKDGITRLVVLPLYPQFSISTSGSSLRLLERIFRYHKQEVQHLEYLFGKKFLSHLQTYMGPSSSGVVRVYWHCCLAGRMST